MVIKKLMKTPIKKSDPMGFEEFWSSLGLSDLIGGMNQLEKKILNFKLRSAIRSHWQGIKQLMAPCRFLFPILEKIYTVFDPCKSWGRDVIPRSTKARGTMSTNKYLPYPTYIHLGDQWQRAGPDKQISRRLTSAANTTVHVTSYLIVNVSPKNIQLNLSVNNYDYSLRIPLRSHHQTKHLRYGTFAW